MDRHPFLQGLIHRVGVGKVRVEWRVPFFCSATDFRCSVACGSSDGYNSERQASVKQQQRPANICRPHLLWVTVVGCCCSLGMGQGCPVLVETPAQAAAQPRLSYPIALAKDQGHADSSMLQYCLPLLVRPGLICSRALIAPVLDWI